jgi:hypothetical protein
MIIKSIYNIISTVYTLPWISLTITIGVCITTMVIGLLVVSPMGVTPI